jgi:prepilin-type N-terminal cleavage/methylation domain-containing protein
MERTDAQFQHHRFGDLGGFSLIELLVALCLASILAFGFWTFAATQDTTYATQDSTGEMQQNLRVAVQMLSGSIMGAGLGPQVSTIDGVDASAWYNAANNWVPTRITATSIDIVGWSGQAPASLNAAVTAGTNTLALQAGQGASFKAGQDINVGATEAAVIQGVAGDNLTLTAALILGHPAGSYVYPLQWVTYSWGAGSNTLSLDQHNGNGPQVVASDIQAVDIAPHPLDPNPADPRAFQVTITGTTLTSPAVVGTLPTFTVVRRSPQTPPPPPALPLKAESAAFE